MTPQSTRQFAAVDIAQRIVLLRQQRVMLDGDLAALYGVPSKALNQAVKAIAIAPKAVKTPIR